MKTAFVARAAPLALLCAGCNHCAPGRPPRRQSAALRARVDASVRRDAARDGGSEPLPPLMQDGCWSGLALVCHARKSSRQVSDGTRGRAKRVAGPEGRRARSERGTERPFAAKAALCTPASRLAALGERCAAGMQPVFAEPRSVTLTRHHASRLAFAVDDPSKCLRVAAVSADRSARLELGLLDAAGHELAHEAGRAGFSLLMPKGPVCVERAGTYRVVVSVRAAHAAALVQVWRAQ